MLFNTFVFSAIAALAATAQAQTDNSCAAGAVIGIFGVCGTNPVDCGSSHCCLEGQKCVTSKSGAACADSSLQTGTTLTVSAGCYGTSTSSATSKSSTGKSTSTGKSSNPATIATPTASQTGADGSTSSPLGGVTTAPWGSSTPAPSGGPTSVPKGHTSASPSVSNGPVPTGPSGFLSAPPYTYTNGTARPTGISTGTGGTKPSPSSQQSNDAPSALTSVQNSIAVLLSGVAIVALWL